MIPFKTKIKETKNSPEITTKSQSTGKCCQCALGPHVCEILHQEPKNHFESILPSCSCDSRDKGEEREWDEHFQHNIASTTVEGHQSLNLVFTSCDLLG